MKLGNIKVKALKLKKKTTVLREIKKINNHLKITIRLIANLLTIIQFRKNTVSSNSEGKFSPKNSICCKNILKIKVK